MGLAGGDASGCLEMSSGYGNFFEFDTGKTGRWGVEFDCTGDGVERIWGKDPTFDASASCLLLYYAQLSCSTSVSVGLFEGSDGGAIVRLRTSDVTYANTGNSQVWDFRDDPLVCMTAENTKSLSVCAGDGYISGFVKVGWGSKSEWG